MPELEIGLADGGQLSFDKSFLQFNSWKKIYVKSSSRFEFKCWILDTASLQLICYYNNAKFTTVFLSKKDNFF